MITIGTVKFDIQTGNEEFAQSLYAHWDRFFQTSFEAVAEEVMSHYDRTDEVLMIDRLPVEIPVLLEEDFEESFPRKLREELHNYFRGLMVADSGAAASAGVQRISVGQNVLDILSFFLLHGYLPFSADNTQYDIHKLLEQVLQLMPDEFRQLLERYAHYDFLYKRLIYQFDDEQLDAIVDKVYPSEAKFIHLYTRMQIRTYRLNPVSEISYSDYRNAVWTLVLAYLFHEGGGRFNKKQLVVHTLRGLSARFNFSFVELTRMLSDQLDELEKNTLNLPELWSILKEIRTDIHGELLALDGNYLKYAYREIIAALRIANRKETAYLLIPENLAPILSDSGSCRELLRQLRETEIYRLVECIIPQESEFIIAYARLLDNHEERGYFRGKVGNDFRLIKWEFIFAVIYRAPLSFFSRTQFVLQVTQQLAAHYNLSVEEVIRFLLADQELHDLLISLKLIPILHTLNLSINPPSVVETHAVRLKNSHCTFRRTPCVSTLQGTLPQLIAVLSYAPSAALFIKQHTEADIFQLIQRIIPGESEFIIAYARLLDNYSGKGLLEGKAGTDFRKLKWEFIFSCLLVGEKVAFFHRKYFIYDVIKQLAAHYNQQIVDLLGYFSKEFVSFGSSSSYAELGQLLHELYHETLLTMSDAPETAKMSKEAAEQWIVFLFGGFRSETFSFLENWLVYSLEKQNDVFRQLWKSGKLDESLIFSILRRDEKLQRLWIRRIGDTRLLEVYQIWMKRFLHLRQQFSGAVFLQTVAFYLSLWIVQLTARRYASWSTTEIEHFLAGRVSRSVPEGMKGLLSEKNDNLNNIHLKQMIKIMNTNVSESNVNQSISIENAGLVLYYPFFIRLFRMLNLVEKKNPHNFVNDNTQIKAIFLLQYVAYGEFKDSYEEHELAFNKIIVGWEGGPLPKKYNLTDEDKKFVEDMVTSLRMHWQKLKGTTNDTLRMAFLQRRGTIKPSDGDFAFLIEVEEKAYDILLDTLPWTVQHQQLFNSEKRLKVKWRNL